MINKNKYTKVSSSKKYKAWDAKFTVPTVEQYEVPKNFIFGLNRQRNQKVIKEGVEYLDSTNKAILKGAKSMNGFMANFS